MNLIKNSNELLQVGTINNGFVAAELDKLKTLASCCEESGDYAGAAQAYYRAFLAGGRADHALLERAVRNLVDGGKASQAEKFLELLRGRIDDGIYEDLAAEVALAAGRGPASGKRPASVSFDGLFGAGAGEFDGEFLDRFIDLFSGRDGVYALQFVDSNGCAGYRPVRERFDRDALLSHLGGELTAGMYPVRSDNTVKFMAFDIDVSRHYLMSCDESEVRSKLGEARLLVTEIVRRLASVAIVPMVEFSGAKGYHVWVFFEEPVAAAVARKFAEVVLAKIDLEKYEYIGVEIFPKQAMVGDGAIGNLIKIPLGVHMKTGRRCEILDASTFEPVKDVRSAVMKAKYMPVKVIETVESYMKTRASKTGVEAPAIRPVCKVLDRKAVKIKPKPEKLTAVQFELFDGTDINGLMADLSVETRALIGSCPVLSFLVKKARHEKYLTHEERLVILYTVGFAGAGAAADIHRIISECSDYRESVTAHFIGTKRENCMGCYRIRQRLPEIARLTKCSCEFRLADSQTYPSPLLHINRSFKRVSVLESKAKITHEQAARQGGGASQAAVAGEPDSAESMALNYLILKKRYMEVLEELKASKNKLMHYMRSEGVRTIELAEGVVSIIDDHGYEKMITVFTNGDGDGAGRKAS
ncbi:MAG TPA: CRISPR-associated primase-polymerase type A1 [Candidatus Wallbacteria bacterium]|nr:CRISPR-associated primase-polymerase type A1 [Candidatus Wallbacteria bacterium]